MVQELSRTELRDIFEQVAAIGLTQIRISGGEPTIHPEFEQIVEDACQNGLRVSLNTHGIFPARIRRVIQSLPLDVFFISLDGLEAQNDFIRGQGMFARAVDTIGWLRGLGRSVVIGVHLSRHNQIDVEGLIDLAIQLDTGIKFAPLRPIGRAKKSLKEVVLPPQEFYQAVKTITHHRELHPDVKITTDFDILSSVDVSGAPDPAKMSCLAGRTMVNVNYDGYVYPCAFLVTPEHEFAAGNIRDTALLDIWNDSPVFMPFRTIVKDDKCQHCRIYGRSCVGGCVAIAYFTVGRLDAHDPTCFSDYAFLNEKN